MIKLPKAAGFFQKIRLPSVTPPPGLDKSLDR
jgi:hypothetical protein